VDTGRAAPQARPLEGEDIQTEHWEDARHLDHPHRYYTASQITSLAWSDSALFPEEVRNYVLRLRKILVRLAIPCDLVNKPGRGYSLTFRDTD
jgi:hypothetical protein